MTSKPRTTARERLAAFLAANPNAAHCLRHADIAQAINASTTRVGQLLPRRKPVRRSAAVALAGFIDEHPEAVLTPVYGGMALKDIAAAIGFGGAAVAAAWRELELPDRTLLKLTRRQIRERRGDRRKATTREWKRKHPEAWRAIARRAANKWRRKRLRDRTCVVCGTVFPWTNDDQRFRRYVTCSPTCSYRARALGKRPRAAIPSRGQRRS